MGAIWEPCALYRSHMAPFERQMVPYVAPMHHMWAIWETCMHYGMQRAPYGSCVWALGAMFSGLHHIGVTCAVWEPHTPYGSRYDICEDDGIIWGQNSTYAGHMEAECAGWELCAILEVDGTMWEAHDTIWKLHGPCDGHMGVVCSTWLAIWELCAPYGSCVHHMGAARAIWELHAPYGSCMHCMRAVWEV
jgi:hypothetical protein